MSGASIVDLKAELARKQREYRQQQASGDKRDANRARARASSKRGPAEWAARLGKARGGKNKGVADRDARDRQQSAEEVQSLDKSARALAAKAQLYDQLKQGNAIASQPGTADGDGAPYLVDFERKATTGESEAAEKADGVASAHSGAGNDWVDYIDEFGRTRRCLRRDLPSQRRAAQEDPYRGQAPWGSGAATGHPGAAPDLMSADMRREREREEWEDQARQEVLHGPIHFETVRNEEIRTMGTGYYRFSTDEAERGEQMQTLNTLRDETKESRKRREALQQRRDAALATRLAKIKRRKGQPVEPEPSAISEGTDSQASVSQAEPSVDEFLAKVRQQVEEAENA